MTVIEEYLRSKEKKYSCSRDASKEACLMLCNLYSTLGSEIEANFMHVTRLEGNVTFDIQIEILDEVHWVVVNVKDGKISSITGAILRDTVRGLLCKTALGLEEIGGDFYRYFATGNPEGKRFRYSLSPDDAFVGKNILSIEAY